MGRSDVLEALVITPCPAQMLKGLGITAEEAKAALAYYTHPTVEGALAVRSATAVRMSVAPTIFSAEEALEHLRSVTDPANATKAIPVRILQWFYAPDVCTSLPVIPRFHRSCCGRQAVPCGKEGSPSRLHRLLEACA